MNIKNIAIRVLSTVEIILFITIVLSYYWSGKLSNPRYIEIPQGSTTAIISKLKASNLDLGWLDIQMIRFFGMPQSGWIDFLDENSSRIDFYYQLTNGKAALQEVKLIPGETTVVALDQIANELELNATKLHTAYKNMAFEVEGVLVPETYKVPMGVNESELIAILIRESLKVHEKEATKYLGSYETKQWFYFLAMASIVEKEAANHQEMPLVASVIYNRLAKRMRLQMDGSLNYGYFSRQKVTAERIRSDFSPYNTYKYAGIPPVPVCMVGKEAIDAVFNPAKTDFLYFVKAKDGSHSFSNSYKKHLQNIKSE